MPTFIDKPTLTLALEQLPGTAGTLFRIWMTLKHMGLSKEQSVAITTSNSESSLVRLFACGHPEGKFYTPYVSQPSDRYMHSEAARSIIQTTVRQWFDGSGVYSPTDFLQVEEGQTSGRSQPLIVSTKRIYPEGLGQGKNGFAHREENRVSVPLKAFAVWYGRQTPIPDNEDTITFLIDELRRDLHLTPAEEACVFVEGSDFPISTNKSSLSDREIFLAIESLNTAHYNSVELPADSGDHIERIRAMQTMSEAPSWITRNPAAVLKEVYDAGAKAILLYGPPRTGKTRAIDEIIPRTQAERTSIQIHDGWGYEHLIQGYSPQSDMTFKYVDGALLHALSNGKKFIVLEEINRTLISQSLGEVFSLLEEGYRGERNAITLRDGSQFYIPEDVVFLMTMNTIDKSTEEVDDALIGRCFCIEFPPRVEDLSSLLQAKGVGTETLEKLCRIFSAIQTVYPLGHGYFSQYQSNPRLYYLTKIRPVLLNHLQHFKPLELINIDNLVDELFTE